MKQNVVIVDAGVRFRLLFVVTVFVACVCVEFRVSVVLYETYAEVSSQDVQWRRRISSSMAHSALLL